MNFEGLKRRVERAEQVVDGRIAQTRCHSASFRHHWKAAWTPGRIVLIGLAGGLLMSRTRPLRALRGVSATRWIQLATSLSGLFASLQAAWAARTAEAAASEAGDAAETAEAVAEDAGVSTGASVAVAPAADEDTVAPSVSDGRRRPDPQWEREPRPAEAATELSER